jgi:hypothetical protein
VKTTSQAFDPAPLRVPNRTTLIHVTHWKAGSQWIRAILQDAFGSELVESLPNDEQVL